MSIKYQLFLLLLCFNFLSTAQDFNIKRYRVSEGLPIDVIKAVSQDSLGFLWIGTDDGLVKYDGISFTNYKSALKSKYVKGFLYTKDHRLLVYGDLDLVEIENKIDTVIFKSLIKGSHNLTDSTISYPKAILQDKDANIWLAESESVVRYKDGIQKRFGFDRKYNSNEFIRSFQLFEDENGNLFVITYNGNIFLYDKLNDTFKLLNGQLCRAINHVLYLKPDLYIASNEGLFKAQIDINGLKNIQKTNFPVDAVSQLLLAPDSSLWASSFIHGLVNIPNVKKSAVIKINYDFNSVNGSFLSKEGDNWVSTDKGLILLQKKIFLYPELKSKSKYIESIVEDIENHQIYFCDKQNLSKYVEISKDKWERKLIKFIPDGYFQTIRTNERGLWVTNAHRVFLFQNDKLVKEWDLSSFGYYVFDLICDQEKNIWLGQSRNPFILKINKKNEISKYKLPIQSGTDVRIVFEGKEGIYVIAHGNIKEYLFLKAKSSEEFKNISLPISENIDGEFQIQNVVVLDNTIWIASTHGLYKYENNTIKRIDLGEGFTEFMVSSISKLDNENILFSNSYGLFRLNIKTNEYWVYDENMGLPSNTITDHGIFVDSKKRVWIGSSNGVAYTYKDLLLDTKKTPTPYCINAKVNGKSMLFSKGIYAPFGSFINLVFSSISFPENKLNLQWKVNSIDTNWKDLKSHELNFSDLAPGRYEIRTRAKKNAGLSWSDSASLFVVIDKPFWMKTQFFLLILFVIGLIIWLSYLVIARVMNKRREYLQNLVKSRTKDLEYANEELSHRNAELDRFVYSASHDLAAPLKSLLGLINITKMEDSRLKVNKYLVMMEGSIKKLDEFIKEVISYSRNTRIEIKYESFDFKELINSILDDHEYSPNFNLIRFEVYDHTNEKMISDVSRLKIILNNLVSNSIKFHRVGVEIIPKVLISLNKLDTDYKITVEDNGRGIPKEHLNSIFEMFFRGTVDVQGSGLGLYILKETVVKLNGKINVDSSEGIGTKFTITIPIPHIYST